MVKDVQVRQKGGVNGRHRWKGRKQQGGVRVGYGGIK